MDAAWWSALHREDATVVESSCLGVIISAAVYGNLSWVPAKYSDGTLDVDTVGPNTFIGTLSAHWSDVDS